MIQERKLKNFFLSVTLIFFIAGCQNHPQKNRYEEVVLTTETSPQTDTALKNPQDSQALLEEMVRTGEDPHAFLKNTKSNSSQPSMGQMSEDPELNNQLLASKTNAPFSWTIPTDWIEAPAGSMRVATFKNEKFSDLDISVVSLSGPAGGLFANVNRWITQLKTQPLSEQAFEQFMSKQEHAKTKEGVPIIFIDLTDLSKENSESAAGIFAAIVELEDKTFFIKMTGTRQELSANLKSFKEFCLSLKKK